MSSDSRQEHLEWCKKRAMEYCERHDYEQAMASFLSDLRKHEGTKDLIELANMMALPILLKGGSYKEVKDFIMGFP